MNERDAGIKKIITSGDVDAVKALLDPAIVKERFVGGTRTLLHLATDWPGHYPNIAAIIRLLVDAGAEVNARVVSPKHKETALHWAASSDDVDALDALLDCGADLEADGGVIGNGTALADAVAFGQWKCARRLVERGAVVNLWQAAALGDEERTKTLDGDVTNAFWSACHGGQLETAKILLSRGADPNWVGHDGLTPLKAAARSKAPLLVEWLTSIGVPG